MSDWSYPGVFGTLRIVAAPTVILGAIINSPPLSTFGLGWWIACLACEFAWHRKAASL